MGVIISNSKHYLTRLPLFIGLIAGFAFSPLLIGATGAWLTKMITGKICDARDCAWAVVHWFSLITIPLGGIALLALIIIVLIDSMALLRKT